MFSLNDIRKQCPEFADASDADLSRAMHKVFAPDVPYEKYATESLGMTLPKQEQEKEPNWLDKSLNTVAAIGEGLTLIPEGLENVASSVWNNGEIDVNDKEAIAERRKYEQSLADYEKKYKGKTWDGATGAMPSLPYSVATMGASLAGGMAGGIAGPVGAGAAGMAAGGTVAYRATKDGLMNQLYDLTENALGHAPSQQEWNNVATYFDSEATKYGIWEAAPEAISNLFFAKLLGPLGSQFKNGIKGALKTVAGTLGEELATETITQMGQGYTEADMGLRDKAPTLGESFTEIAPTTIWQTALMGGGKKALDYGYRRISRNNSENTDTQDTPPGQPNQTTPPQNQPQNQPPQTATLAGAFDPDATPSFVEDEDVIPYSEELPAIPQQPEQQQNESVEPPVTPLQAGLQAVLGGGLQVRPSDRQIIEPVPRLGYTPEDNTIDAEFEEYPVENQRALPPAQTQEQEMLPGAVQGVPTSQSQDVPVSHSGSSDGITFDTIPEAMGQIGGAYVGNTSPSAMQNSAIPMPGNTSMPVSSSGNVSTPQAVQNAQEQLHEAGGITLSSGPGNTVIAAGNVSAEDQNMRALGGKFSAKKNGWVFHKSKEKGIRDYMDSLLASDVQGTIETQNTPTVEAQDAGLGKIRDAGNDGREGKNFGSGLEQGGREPVRGLDDSRSTRGFGEEGSPDGQPAQTGRRGKAVSVKVPQHPDLNTEYELVESNQIQASHLPNAGFQKNPAYALENERRYHDEPASQEKVLRNASTLDPEFLVNYSVDANNGAPVVDADGNVLGGNGRAMSIDNAYEKFPERGKAYKEALKAKAEELGVNPAEVDTMERPVLVRRVQGSMSPEERQSLVSSLNEDFKDSKERKSSGKSRGDRFSKKTLSNLAKGLQDADSLRSFFDTQESAATVELLLEDGVIQQTEKNAYIGADGLLNSDGKKVVEEALRGRVFRKYDDIAKVPADFLGKLDAAIPHILIAEQIGGKWNITGQVSDAIELMSRFKGSGGRVASVFLNQLNMLTGNTPIQEFSPQAVRLFLFSLENNKKEFVSAFAKYAQQARISPENGGIPGIAKTPEKAFSDSFGEVQGKAQQKGQGKKEEARQTPEAQEQTQPPEEVLSNFSKETKTEPKENADVEQRTGNLEQDSQRTDTGNGMGEESLQADGKPDGSHGGKGIGQAGKDVSPAGREGLSGREAAPSGKNSDSEMDNEASGVRERTAGSEQSGRSDRDSEHGLDVQRDGESTTERASDKSADRKVKEASAHLQEVQKALPGLYPGQQEDVVFAEKRFKAGHGVMFTNGTGTGKTGLGLGVISRLVTAGRDNILIAVPADKIGTDWKDLGKRLGVEVSKLKDTNDAGQGVTITTHANMAQNKAIATREWDLVVIDEAHKLASSEAGKTTHLLEVLRALTRHPRGVSTRARMLPEGDKLYKALLDAENAYKENQNKDNKEKQDEARSAFKKFVDSVREEVKSAQGRTRSDLTSARDGRAGVMFLSATPFAYEKNIDYAEGYLFDYPAPYTGGYNIGTPFDQFMVEHFGYRMRYGKLTQPDAEVDSGLLQRQFNSWLKKQGVLSSRNLDTPFDYDRKFILTENAVGQKIDEGLNFLSENHEKYRKLSEYIEKRFDHLAKRYLLEAIKAKESIGIIRENLSMGRKVVVFHQFNKGGGFNPFDISDITPYGDSELYEQAKNFKQERPDLANLPLKKLASPVETLKAAFPDAQVFSGLVSNKKREEIVSDFQKDEGGASIIIVQADAGEAGLSLHDTTGKHQRVLINLGLPTKPVTAIQQEGRIFRSGQKSNAMFRYLNTGTNWELMAFAQTIAQRASAAENLALGEEARGLKDSFINAFIDSAPADIGEHEGVGGKAADRELQRVTSEFDRAKSFYFSQQKKNSRTKAQEGSDYFATPEPLGQKMVEWAGIQPGSSVLEPSAGHGAIARWFPENANRTVVEPSNELASRLMLATDANLKNVRFEELDIVNKYDSIVMNPPFGKGGKTAMDHIEKAFRHLRNNGRIVAIVPEGPAMQKRLDSFFEYDEKAQTVPVLRSEVILPSSTFERAGTNTRCKVLIIDAANRKELQSMHTAPASHVELSEAKTIGELFDRIENMGAPARMGQKEQTESFSSSLDTDSQSSVTQKESQSPVSPSQPGTKQNSASHFETAETEHAIKHIPLFVARKKNNLSDNEYKKVSSIAKKHGGYWSSFNRNGAIPGWQFSDAKSRDAFITEADTALGTSVMASLSERTERNSDNTPVQVVEVQPGIVPEFKKIGELVKWLKEYFNDKRTERIESTQKVVLFSNTGLSASTKRVRESGNKEAYEKLNELVRKAIFERFEANDVRHPNLGGQEIYYSAMRLGEKLYAVRLSLDVPSDAEVITRRKLQRTSEIEDLRFKGHELKEIEIAPITEHYGFEGHTAIEAIHEVTLGVLRDSVNPSRLENGVLSSTTPGEFLSPHVQGKPIRKNAVSSIVDKLINRAKTAAKTEVVQSFSELPEHIQRQFKEHSTRLEGVYDPETGKVWLIAENLSSSERAAEVWMHENLVHHGLRGLLGQKGLSNVLNSLWVQSGGMKNAAVAEIAKRYGLNPLNNAQDRALVMEEYLASLAEKRAKTALNAQEKTFWKRFVNAVMQAWRAMVHAVTGHEPSGMTPQSMEKLLDTLEAYVFDGVTTERTGQQKGQRVGEPAFASVDELTPEKALEEVRRKYEGTDQWMKAPNGKKTNLNERQWLQVRTPQFKEWFGDWENDAKNASKVVDENGEPKVLYHFTNKTGEYDESSSSFGMPFEEFIEKNGGIYFTDDQNYENIFIGGGYGYTYEVFIKAKNLIDATENGIKRGTKGKIKKIIGTSFSRSERSEIAKKNDIRVWNPVESFFNGDLWSDSGRDNQNYIIERMRSEFDADGIFFSDAPSGGAGPEFVSWVVFSSSQVKSAMSNVGTFDSDNPSILASLSPLDSFRSKIGSTKPTLREKLDAIRHDWRRKLDQNVFDRFSSIKDFSEEGYRQARMTTSLETQIQAVLEHGAPVWREGLMDIEQGSKGLADILKPVSGELDQFLQWMVARRAKRLLSEGREHLFTEEEIEAALALNQGKLGAEKRESVYNNVADAFAEFNKKVLDFAEQGGILDKESRKVWENADYIPFYRVQEALNGKVLSPNSKSALSGQNSGIQHLTGGTSNIGDPLANIIQNMSHLIDAAQKNKAAVLILNDMYKANVAQKLSPEEVEKMEQLQGKRLVDMLKNDKELASQFGPMTPHEKNLLARTLSPEQLSYAKVMYKGKAYYFSVSDPLLFNALTGVFRDNSGKGAVMGFLKSMRRILTKAVTVMPDFVLRNFLRDTLHTWTIEQKSGYKPLISSLAQVRNVFNMDDDMKSLLASGSAFMGSGYMLGGSKEKAAAQFRQHLGANEDSNTSSILDTPRKIGSFLKVAFGYYERAASASENAARLSVYKKMIEKGYSHREAAFASKDLMDFTMRGESQVIQFLCESVPFLGARLAGLHRLGSGAKENPKAFALKGSMIAVASMALYAINMALHPDEWDELEEWSKDSYFHFWVDGKHFMLPKPFEVGFIFGTIPERLMEQLMTDRPGRVLASRITAGVMEQLAFNPVPQAVKPLYEAYANWDTFRETPIVGYGTSKKLPVDQHSSSTSLTARAVAGFMDTMLSPVMGKTGADWVRSPAHIEHLVSGYLGSLGMLGLGMSDMIITSLTDQPPAPDRKIENYPLVRSFYKGDGPRKTRYESELYKILKEGEGLYASLKQAVEDGESAEEFKKDLSEEELIALANRKGLGSITRTFSKLNTEAEKVRSNRNMPSSQKRIELDNIQERKNILARQAWKKIDAMRTR